MEQQQQQYDDIGNVRGNSGSDLKIQERIKSSLPLIIRILAYIQTALNVLIFAMEIGIIICYARLASLTTLEYAEVLAGPLTVAGIWTSIVMDIAIYFLFKLAKQINERRMWKINIVTQSILFLFTIILIGITGNYVDRHYSYQYPEISGYHEEIRDIRTKYQLHQAQLAFAILMFFSAILFIGLFLYLYLIARSSSESANRTNNNDPPGIQQQQIWRMPIPSSSNQVSKATPNDVVLKDIQCPNCRATVPLPVPNGTHIPSQQLHSEYVPVQ